MTPDEIAAALERCSSRPRKTNTGYGDFYLVQGAVAALEALQRVLERIDSSDNMQGIGGPGWTGSDTVLENMKRVGRKELADEIREAILGPKESSK